MQPTVYFAHGRDSGPWGRKIQVLAELARERGFAVESPDYRFSKDPQARIDHLLSLDPPAGRELILVGSSMGGYVSAVASRELKPRGLFLMAPAVYMPGYEPDPQPVAGRMAVVHGWNDEVIPVEHAVRFARAHRAELHLLDDDHSLVGRLDCIAALFGEFLDRSTEIKDRI